MPEAPTSRPVLAGKPALSDVGITLTALPEGHLLQIMGTTTHEALEGALSAAGLGDSAIRSGGYRQWYVMGDKPLPATTVRKLSDALPVGAWLSDQSHGRVRIRLAGRHAVELLAKGTAVDLHPSAFTEGQSAITLFGHVTIHLTRTGTAEFELSVLRSFAEALYEELAHLARSTLVPAALQDM